MERRHFITLLTAAGSAAVAQRALGLSAGISSAGASPSLGDDTLGSPELVRYPQKTDLILLTDRPPQLETPLRYFQTDLTPNEAFFVRWHLSGIPTSVDTRSFRLDVTGHVRAPLSLSL